MNQDALLRILLDFAGTLVEEYDLDEVLGSLGQHVAELFDVEGAGVMLEDAQGDLRFVSASDDGLRHIEELQIELGEGPCLLAYRSGLIVNAADVTEDERFPRFGEAAAGFGIRGVFSVPLTYRDATVGAFNIYDSRPHVLDDDQIAVAVAVARAATLYLLHARDAEDMDRQLDGLIRALESRPVIEQAKGYLAASLGIAPEEARELVRRWSRSRQRRVRDVSEAIVAGRLDPAVLREEAGA
ncbi:MAG: GAF and ANTAR domain-containing protein [Actinobacteria bacterium]|nr:GAF and ANTAR domain-containing protein [Actinomycetota bacterium]